MGIFQGPAHAEEKVKMPSGGSGYTPICSPIRGHQEQPDLSVQSWESRSYKIRNQRPLTKQGRGSSRREGSRAGPSAKVDLENLDSEQGGKADPPFSDYQDRRVRRKSPKPQGPAIYAEVSNEVFKKADPRYQVDKRADQSREEVRKDKEGHQRTRSQGAGTVMGHHGSAQASDNPVYSRQDKRWEENHKDARSHQRKHSQDQDRGPWEGMTSTSHQSSVELVARASLPKNDWKDFKPQNLRTPHQSPRSRAESDEAKRPPPNWEGEGDQAELDALARDRAKRSRRGYSPRGRPHQERPAPRSRSRSQSQSAIAKFKHTWNPRSQNNAMHREDLSTMLHKMYQEFGPARQWRADAAVFEHEGPTIKEHVGKRAWAQPHTPIWCTLAQEARAAEEGSRNKRAPPSGFYPLTRPSASSHDQADEDALMCVSGHFSGLRYISGDRRKPGWCHKFETLTVVSHYDQIWQAEKNTKEEIHRSFEIYFAASNLPIQDWVRLILTELQDRGISVSRITHVHPLSLPRVEDLGPTKIVVVFNLMESKKLLSCFTATSGF